MDDPAADLAQLTKKPTPSFKDEVEELEEADKKQVTVRTGGKEGEPVPDKHFIEIPTTPEVKEAEGYLERVEKEVELQKPIIDDYTQQVLLKSSAPQNPKITLPLTDDQIQKGLHHHVWEAIRWLAEWCVRQMKIWKS